MFGMQKTSAQRLQISVSGLALTQNTDNHGNGQENMLWPDERFPLRPVPVLASVCAVYLLCVVRVCGCVGVWVCGCV